MSSISQNDEGLRLLYQVAADTEGLKIAVVRVEQALEVLSGLLHRIDERMETLIEQNTQAYARMEALIAQGSAIVDAYVAQQQGGA
jgi:hypothetical protein